ncbi:MAG: zinc ribbon domain-containing protein [Acidobacteriota bacterium]|nr:zinc ribbon domain-containing protein [Acidobacteriota bacterium]
MRCPECKTPYEANAASCSNCGLLLLKLAPHRRSEDFATQKRRSADQLAPCKFCGSEIPLNAIRCRQCSEIVNDEFYRERAHRTRSRINYASWVAYIFGLAALLVFRPVGLVSIAAGLLLSILYYAIPVEPPASKRNPRARLSLWQRIRQQVRLERVSIPIPNFPKRKLVFVGTPLIAAIIGYSANVMLLQQPVNDVLRENAAFRGMEVSAHYQYYMVPGVVVYDLRAIGVRQTPIDVHTAFLEFAKKVRDKRYKRVDLSYRGTTKFSIDGASFHKIGEEYAKRNFDYVLYTFPRLFHHVGASSAAVKPSASDRDALLQFHRQWYGDDQLTRSVANGM